MEEAFSARGWLEKIGLAQYGDAFESNGLTDAEVISGVTDNDLKDIGVTVLGHRKKLLLEAGRVLGGGAAPAPAGGGGGGGAAAPAGGGGGGSAPRPVTKVLPNLWKLTWDDAHCSKEALSGILYDTMTGWYKQDGDAHINGVTVGRQALLLWNWEDVAPVKKIEITREHRAAGQNHTAFDVWESQKLVVAAMKPSFDGNLLALYNMDTGDVKELRKDNSEGYFSALRLLPKANPAAIVVAQDGQIRMFDANTSRPLSSWRSEERWPCYIVNDPLQPNVFYVGYRKYITVFDKNVKSEVRKFVGLDGLSSLQMPCAPGNQLIASDAHECKIWDVGTGRTVHTIGQLKSATASSLFGNVLAIAEQQNLKIYDLNESASEPARELAQAYQDMKEIGIIPSKIIVLSHNYAWATTKFEA